MKLPAPAFFLEPARPNGLPVVTIRPCLVLATFSTGSAIIELHSLQVSGRVSRTANFSDLASTIEKAVEEATARIKALPALPGNPASDEKAATAEVAGAGAGSALST